MVFQNYALFPHMNVARNVGFGLKMRGLPKAEIERKRRRGAQPGAARRPGHKLPGQLSGGQQQRVAIARAIVIEPPLVLMDEPLSNLDAKLRLEMRAEIRRIHDQLGSATIYVTHDQDEALSLADRIVVMRDGAVRQVGTPEELYARPAACRRRRLHGLSQRHRRRATSAPAARRATVRRSAMPRSSGNADRAGRRRRRRRGLPARRICTSAADGPHRRHGRQSPNIAAASSSVKAR